MKELLISSLLGVSVLALDLLKLRKAIFPVIIAGLTALIISLFADWNQAANPFGNNMLLMDHFALASIGVLALLSIFWFFTTSEAFGTDSRRTDLYALTLFSFAGAVILVSCTNMVMLFLGIEILSIPLYVLASSKKHNVRSNEAGFKYFFLGSVASAIMLFGIALVYGSTGSFDFAEIAVRSAQGLHRVSWMSAGVILIIAGFAFKVSAAPFHFWAPDVYQGTPTPFTGLMASVVKGAAFLALFRVLAGPLAGTGEISTTVLAFLAGLTLIVSNIMAAVQTNVKRLLAFSSISHAGFMLGAVMVPGSSGDVIAFYVLTYGLSSIGTFAILQIVSSYQNDADDISSLNGLVRRNPLLAGTFTLCLLSMAGIPPLSGFMAKYFVITSVVNSSFVWLAVIMILTSVIGVYYYLRLIVSMFTPVENSGRIVLRDGQRIAFITLSAVLLILFFAAGWFQVMGI